MYTKGGLVLPFSTSDSIMRYLISPSKPYFKANNLHIRLILFGKNHPRNYAFLMAIPQDETSTHFLVLFTPRAIHI